MPKLEPMAAGKVRIWEMPSGEFDPLFEPLMTGINEAGWMLDLEAVDTLRTTSNPGPELNFGQGQPPRLRVQLVDPEARPSSDDALVRVTELAPGASRWPERTTSRGRLAAVVKEWLERQGDSPAGPGVVALQRAIERAAEEIQSLVDDIEDLTEENQTLRLRLAGAEAEIEQLRLVRDALTHELRKPQGPRRRTARLFAQAATHLVAVIAGAAGGASQELVARAMTQDPPPVVVQPKDVSIDVGPVVVACADVIALSDESPEVAPG